MAIMKESTLKEFILTRVFDAPRDLIWKALSEKDHLKKWWGPKGFEIRGAKLDFKPGGVFHYQMKSTGGEEMWGQFVYREVVPHERIVWVNSFSEITGGVHRHPLLSDWPLEMLITLTLTQENQRTTLTLRSRAINATDQECAVFEAGFDNMAAGFGGTFDQLAEHLSCVCEKLECL